MPFQTVLSESNISITLYTATIDWSIPAYRVRLTFKSQEAEL